MGFRMLKYIFFVVVLFAFLDVYAPPKKKSRGDYEPIKQQSLWEKRGLQGSLTIQNPDKLGTRPQPPPTVHPEDIQLHQVTFAQALSKVLVYFSQFLETLAAEEDL